MEEITRVLGFVEKKRGKTRNESGGFAENRYEGSNFFLEHLTATQILTESTDEFYARNQQCSE